MEPVHSNTVGPVKVVSPANLVHSKEWCGVSLILPVYVPAPGASDVVFSSCAADSREISVAVHVKLDFAFSEPVVVIALPGQVCTYIMSLSFYPVYNYMVLFVLEGIASVPFRMEVGGIFRNFGECIVHLIEESMYFTIC